MNKTPPLFPDDDPIDGTPHFDGDTYSPSLDYVRLATQLGRVFRLMSDGTWRTLAEIRDGAGGSEAGCSARLRDLRKSKFGSHTVLDRRRGAAKSGLWEYQLVLPDGWLEKLEAQHGPLHGAHV